MDCPFCERIDSPDTSRGNDLAVAFPDAFPVSIDWLAKRIRAADSFTRGELDSPKSHEGRSVPMAGRLAAELERLFQRSGYWADTDLVFCRPENGSPFDPSKLRKRFKAA